MPAPRRPQSDTVDALIAIAPLVSRWIERLLAGHQPPLTSTQFLALRTIAAEDVSGSELARRTGVSGPAVSQLLASLADSGLLERRELAEDRRRVGLTLSTAGRGVLASAQTLLREHLATLLPELPRPEAEALARALPHLQEALSGAPPPRRPSPARPPPPRAPRTPP